MISTPEATKRKKTNASNDQGEWGFRVRNVITVGFYFLAVHYATP
jgi:hypothetical protein